MGLVLEDKITLSTRFGTSQIQLMLGDITDLPVEEKVDVIFTSAFPGDYAAIKGTLIHALTKKLDISVRALARNKELDLTRIFSCWLSKPLPPDKPYRRLVCFEVLQHQTLTEQISMMFRAIMPIFNGNESTVITPPLATGCQGCPIDQMLGVMVNTACHWIKAGLPLKCLKLVLFARDIDQARAYTHAKSIDLFTKLKTKWHAKESKAIISKSIDITFSFHFNDKKYVEGICKTLLKDEKSLSIHQDAFKMKEEESWQDEVFDIMANSARIVVVLTTSFVSDKWCVEQFSLAMCCNRFKGVEMVTPFYLETVDAFPSYMNLVQYHDCRTNDKETSEEKISSACKDLIQAIHTQKAVSMSQDNTTDDMEKKPVPVYDVFISYCHRTSDIAKMAVEYLSKKYPDIKVFFDRSELKTGNLWQQALYEAVDQTRCLVAMLSDAYIKSTVCQEEYYISLARLIAKDDFLLVPVCVPELTTFPESYTKTKAVSVSSKSDVEELIDKIMPTVLNLKDAEKKKYKEVKRIEAALIDQRYSKFSKEYEFNWEQKEIQRKIGVDSVEDFSDMEARISFSYTSDGLKFAAVLTDMLQKQGPKITSNLLSFNQVEVRREIDNADMVVIFLSNEFLESQHHVEELHIALCRQRMVKDRTVIYLVELSSLDEGFFYPSILPFRVSLNDHMWESFSKTTFQDKVQRYSVYAAGMAGTYMCSPTEFVALQMMTKDILGLLSQRGKGSEIETNLVNVVSMETRNKHIEDKDVSPGEVAVSVSSYVTPKACWNEDEDEDDSESEPEQMPEMTAVTNKELDSSSSSLQNTTFVTSPYDIDNDSDFDNKMDIWKKHGAEVKKDDVDVEVKKNDVEVKKDDVEVKKDNVEVKKDDVEVKKGEVDVKTDDDHKVTEDRKDDTDEDNAVNTKHIREAERRKKIQLETADMVCESGSKAKSSSKSCRIL